MSRTLVVLILFVIAASYSNTRAQGRSTPGFPQRRLLNLSGNTIGQRRLLNLSGNTIGQRRLLNLSGNSVEPTEVPESLLVKAGNNLHIVLKAKGFQNYVFENGNWTLYNASATLRTFAGKEVGKHYFLPEKDALGGQPTWKSFAPESLCTGAPSVKVTVSQDSIPWLLLEATETFGSSIQFGEVTYVQRLYTENGLAPDSSHLATPGETFKSPYTAVYFFYKKG